MKRVNGRIVLDVIKNRAVYLTVTAVLVLACIFCIAFRGFSLGIDFEGGLALTVKIQNCDFSISQVRASVAPISGARVQNIGADRDGMYQIRLAFSAGQDRRASENKVASLLEKTFGSGCVSIVQSDYIGASFSGEIVSGSIKAVSIALVLILLYVWFRFRVAYAICAVVALMHDVLCMFGFISLFSFEITSTTIAAILTIIGYSLNNTIVIFDRVRELIEEDRKQKLDVIIDNGVSGSLRRTTYSSITTLAAVLPLAILASGDVRSFAICMIWGIICGTWSSNFVATSLLFIIGRRGIMDVRKERVKDEVDFSTPGPKILV